MKKFYEILQNLGYGVVEDGVWKNLWDVYFSLLFLVRVWFSIILVVKYMMKESDGLVFIVEQWVKVRSLFRK